MGTSSCAQCSEWHSWDRPIALVAPDWSEHPQTGIQSSPTDLDVWQLCLCLRGMRLVYKSWTSKICFFSYKKNYNLLWYFFLFFFLEALVKFEDDPSWCTAQVLWNVSPLGECTLYWQFTLEAHWALSTSKVFLERKQMIQALDTALKFPKYLSLNLKNTLPKTWAIVRAFGTGIISDEVLGAGCRFVFSDASV